MKADLERSHDEWSRLGSIAVIQFTYQTILALRSIARIRVSCAIRYSYQGRTSANLQHVSL
jgi:hypothetical protein